MLVTISLSTILRAEVDHSFVDTFSSDTTTLQVTDTVLTDSLNADTLIRVRKDSPIKSRIRYSALDSFLYDISGTKVYLSRGAEVYYENISLKADYIVLDQKNKIVYARGVPDSTGKIVGKPVFTDNGQVYNSDEMTYNFETKKGKIKEVTTKEGEGYLLADDVKKNQYDEVFIRNGKYTTCNLPHPHFYIALTKAKNTENKTVSGPAYLVVEDVPLPLAIPFGFFPRKSGRSSGILLPEIGEDRELGFFLRNGGYYFGINDYVDLALRGDIYSRGSYGFSTVSRYNARYKFNGNVAAGYTNRKFGEPETISFAQTKDFYIRWTHLQDGKARPGSTFGANVNIASRTNYRNTVTTNLQSILQNNLSSSVSYSKNWAGTPFSLSSSLSHYQNLQTGEVTLGLPRLQFNVSRVNPFDSKNRIGDQKWFHKIGFNYTLNADNKISTYDSLLFRKETLSKFQNGIQHAIPISTSFNVLKYFTLSPQLNYTERWYFSSIEKTWNGSSVQVDTIQGFKQARDYAASAALTTRIYGMFNVNKMGIQAIRHVAVPSLSYSYRPDFAKPGFGYYKKVRVDSAGTMATYSVFENGIYGTPGAGKSSVLSFSLDNNLEMKTRRMTDTGLVTKKIRLFDNLRIGGNYNMAADSLKLSNISISARSVILDRINIDVQSAFDPYTLVQDSTGTARRVNVTELDKNKRLARLVSAGVTVGTSLNPQAFKPKTPEQQKVRSRYDQMDLDYIDRNPEYYVDWTIPWNLSVSYFLQYNRPLYTKTISQSVNFSGDVNVTKKWKVGFSSGYDITRKEVTPTALNIYRDLHCWDLAINWIPFGTYQQYSVDLKVKASILQDLKLSRRRQFYERD